MSDSSEPTPQPGETITIPVAEFEALKQQVTDWKERSARSQADFDNARKRLRKEADEAGTRAVARFVRPVLDEMDNLDRALSNAAPDKFNEFAQGVTLIKANLVNALAQSGIEAIPCEGRFDPANHEVIAETEHAELPKGHIVQVHRTGWRLKDQLVRSAQVIVAKPQQAAAPNSSAG